MWGRGPALYKHNYFNILHVKKSMKFIVYVMARTMWLDFEEKKWQRRLYVSIQLIHNDLNTRLMNSYRNTASTSNFPQWWTTFKDQKERKLSKDQGSLCGVYWIFVSNKPSFQIFPKNTSFIGIQNDTEFTFFRQVCMRAKHFKYEEKFKRNEFCLKQKGKNIKQNERKRKWKNLFHLEGKRENCMYAKQDNNVYFFWLWTKMRKIWRELKFCRSGKMQKIYSFYFAFWLKRKIKCEKKQKMLFLFRLEAKCFSMKRKKS